MAETKQATAAVDSNPGNNGTTAAKPETTAPSAKPETTVSPADDATQPVKKSASTKKTWLKKLIPVVVLALAAIILFGISGGWSRWVGSGRQKTDDAILRADITPLSTRVSGTVAQVAVSDYQRVKAGDLLVQLKDDDFKAQVAQAEAGVSASEAALENNAKQKELQAS